MQAYIHYRYGCFSFDILSQAPQAENMLVHATACVYRELYGKITDRKKIV